MDNTYRILPAQAADKENIISLLGRLKLPVSDLTGELKDFFVIKEGPKIIAVIGLETHGEHGLLRSMATHPAYRKNGLATSLVNRLIEVARTKNLKDIYLLTTTAEKFFEQKGFQKVDRNMVPQEIKQTPEFSSLCPSTSVIMKKEVESKKKVLFVCVENSNRSQMSQAFATIFGGDNVEAFSAGSKPSGIVNPKAIAAMKELDYDLSMHDSKSLKEVEQYAPFDAVVTMGCGDACPWMPAKKFIDWQIPDPKNMDPEEFNQVRDLIREKVRELLDTL